MGRRKRHFRSQLGSLTAAAEPAPVERDEGREDEAVQEGEAGAAAREGEAPSEPPREEEADREGEAAGEGEAPTEPLADMATSETVTTQVLTQAEPGPSGAKASGDGEASREGEAPADPLPPPAQQELRPPETASPETTQPAPGPTDDTPVRRPFPLPGRRESRFQVVIARSVLNALHAHARESDRIEIGGVLLGNVYEDDAGRFLHLQASVRGTSGAAHSSQVTFTADDWTHMADEQERLHADKKMAGWYHSHPGHGIFLSGMDLFIQEHFFNLPWQVALVYDPHSGEDGIFVWKEGKTVRDELLIEEDVPADEPPAPAKPLRAAEPDHDEAPAVPVSIDDLVYRLDAMERRQKSMMAVIVLLAVAVIAWPFILNVLTDKGDDGRPVSPATQNADASWAPSTRPAGSPAAASTRPASPKNK